MRKALAAIVAAALLVPAAATAKERIGDARVMFTPVPKGIHAGQAWDVRFWFFFRNGEPYRVSGLNPSVTIRNTVTGRTRVFGVVQDDSTYYSARIRFPARGTWTVTFRFDTRMAIGTRRLVTVGVR